MSYIGFYRYKTTADSSKTVSLYVNEVLTATKSVEPLNSCDNDLIVKYIDNNGQYRFYNFNSFYEINNSPSKIGSVNKFSVDIESDQTDSHNVGYENERKYLVSTDVDSDMLDLFSQIYTSPRVYLYIGDGTTDLQKDWIEIQFDGNNPISKRRRGNNTQIEAIIKLPNYHTITML